MRYGASVGVMLASCVLSFGCGNADLRDYEPVGLSAECLLPSLAVASGPYFVVRPEDSPSTVFDLIRFYGSNVAHIRSSTEGFRMLCALVNRYFGDWERLVIIERLDHGGWVATGFIVVAVTRDGLMGVTNFDLKGPDGIQWTPTARLRAFRLDRAKFQSCLAELDRARGSTWLRPFLWYECSDWPFYFLHDIKREPRPWPSDKLYEGCGPITSFHFAFSGWALLAEGERARLLNAPRDYARAEKSILKYKPWQEYVVDSKADKELREAGATYASLLSFVWECTLGQPDHGVLGVYPSADAPEQPSATPEHSRGHGSPSQAARPGVP